MSYSICQFLLDLEPSENQVMVSQETAYLVIFTEEIRNGKLHFLCAVAILCISCQWYFSESLKTLKIKRFSDVLRGYRKRTVACHYFSHHVKTSQLICNANILSGFCMKETSNLSGLSSKTI